MVRLQDPYLVDKILYSHDYLSAAANYDPQNDPPKGLKPLLEGSELQVQVWPSVNNVSGRGAAGPQACFHVHYRAPAPGRGALPMSALRQ